MRNHINQVNCEIVIVYLCIMLHMNIYIYINFTDAKDLIEHLLVVDKKKRYTAIETLSHPWILLNGDMSRPPESSKLDEMRKNTRKELELQAKQSYDSYQKLKEKRKLEQQVAS